MDCRSEFVSSVGGEKGQSISTDGASVGRVGVDVATEFASQIGDRGKNAASDDLALDFGEPDLDLVEPRGIGGREVKLRRADAVARKSRTSWVLWAERLSRMI